MVRATMKRWRQALIALLFCACSVPALAGPLIYDSGTTVDAGWPAMGESPLTVDAFRLDPGSSTIAGVRWSGLYSGESVPAVETFLIRIFADAGGSPGTSPALHSLQVSPARVDTGTDLPLFDPIPRNLLEYSADLAPLALAPDTLYWLSISLLSASPDNWFWGARWDQGACSSDRRNSGSRSISRWIFSCWAQR